MEPVMVESAERVGEAAGKGVLHHSESLVISAVEWLKLGVETMGATIIGIGILVAAIGFIRVVLKEKEYDFFAVRLSLARYLALALEFQLGADILATAIAPSWDQIGKLGAIAVIRTALNYFLMREMTVEAHHTIVSSEQR